MDDCKCAPGKQACKCQEAGPVDYIIAVNDICRVRHKARKLDAMLGSSPYERGKVETEFFKSLCPRWRSQQTISTSRAIERLIDYTLLKVKMKNKK